MFDTFDSLSYFQNLKHPDSVLQKSNSHLVFGADTQFGCLSVWPKLQYEQHVIKFIAICCYSTVNQVYEARNILVPSVTAKSFNIQC